MKNELYEFEIPATRGTRYRVRVEPSGENDGMWTAEVRALRLVTEGRGPNRARHAAINAVAGQRKVAKAHGFTLPDGDIQVAYRVGRSEGGERAIAKASPWSGVRSAPRKKAAAKKSVGRKKAAVKKKAAKKASR